jgi:hypothetical protein
MMMFGGCLRWSASAGKLSACLRVITSQELYQLPLFGLRCRTKLGWGDRVAPAPAVYPQLPTAGASHGSVSTIGRLTKVLAIHGEKNWSG